MGEQDTKKINPGSKMKVLTQTEYEDIYKKTNSFPLRSNSSR